MTTHGGCRIYLPTECNFGILQPIYLPPHSVSIPRTEVPIEAIIGVQVKSKTSLMRDFSCRKYLILLVCARYVFLHVITYLSIPLFTFLFQKQSKIPDETCSLSYILMPHYTFACYTFYSLTNYL